MKKTDLAKLGLDEELAEQIIILHGKDIEAIKAEKQAALDSVTSLQQQLTDASAAIDGFKQLDVEGVKKAADEWKTKAEQAELDRTTQIKALKYDYALDGALKSAKAKNPKAAKALLDLESVKYNDETGEIEGLAEQLTKVKSENDYLFEPDDVEDEDEDEPTIVMGTKNISSVVGDNTIDAARKAAGLK